MPSALEAGVADKWIGVVLAARPDLYEPLVELLSRIAAAGTDPDPEELWHTEPEAFRLLVTTVAGAYFLSPEVKASLSYPGPRPDPAYPDDAESERDADLVARAARRPPLYRPTP